MVKANKKSLDAKAYINAQVNEIREKIRKAPDEKTRQKLIETFNELTSSDEYQENLAVVQEDTDTIRGYARRKKGGDITPEEFDAAKMGFYGRNMELDFGEEFKKLDLSKRVDYIFERFGDTKYSTKLIVKLLLRKIKQIKNEGNYFDELDVKKQILGLLFNNGGKYKNIGNAVNVIVKKFGMGCVGLNLSMFFAGTFDGKAYEPELYNKLWYLCEKYGTETWLEFFETGTSNYNTIFSWLKFKEGEMVGLNDYTQNLIHKFIFCKIVPDFGKMTPELQKYFIINFLSKWKDNPYVFFFSEGPYKSDNIVLNKSINLGEGVDPFNYIMAVILKKYSDYYLKKFFEHEEFYRLREYHKKIAELFIKKGKIGLLKEYIDKFDGLTEIEKAEILGNTEFEDRLNREKFDSDLAKLRELGEKLGITITVEEKK